MSALLFSCAALLRCPQLQQTPTQNRGGRASTTRVHAAESFCKDMVNERKQVVATGSAIVTFMGAEGSQVAVEVPKDSYILDAGLEAGLELPYTCKGGICGACVGRVVSGSVDQSDASTNPDSPAIFKTTTIMYAPQIDDLSFTIDEEEQTKGMALICMARPVEDCTIETQSDWGYSLGVGEWKGPTGHILGKQVDPLTQGM